MVNHFDIADAIEEFEEAMPHWGRYEILPGFGRKQNMYRIYDSKKDDYVDIRRAKSFISDLNTILVKHGLQTLHNGMSDHHNPKRPRLNLKIRQRTSWIEKGYEGVEEDLMKRFGKYLLNLTVTKDYNTGKPFVKFYYMGNPSSEIREEIKTYIVDTYQS